MSQDPPEWARGLVGDMTTLKGDMTTLKGDMTTLKGDVTTLKGDVTTLKGDVTTLTAKVSEIETQTVKNCGKLDYIQEQLKDLATQEHVDDIQRQLTNLQNTAATQVQINGLHREIDSLKDDRNP